MSSEEELLGKGAFGGVYKVTRNGTTLAKKVFVQTKEHEYQKEKCIYHQLPKSNYLLELVSFSDETRTLYIKPCGVPFPEDNTVVINQYTIEQRIQYVYDICHALIHLHANNIVHLDVKVQNIIIFNNRARLCDYGTVIFKPTEKNCEIKTEIIKPYADFVFDICPAHFGCDWFAFGITSARMLGRYNLFTRDDAQESPRPDDWVLAKFVSNLSERVRLSKRQDVIKALNGEQKLQHPVWVLLYINDNFENAVYPEGINVKHKNVYKLIDDISLKWKKYLGTHNYYQMRSVKWEYNTHNQLLHSENFYKIRFDTETNRTADADFICNSEGDITHIGVWIGNAIAPFHNIHCNLTFERYDTEIKDFLRTLLLVGNVPFNKVTETNKKICASALFQLDCITKDGLSSFPTQYYPEPPHAPSQSSSSSSSPSTSTDTSGKSQALVHVVALLAAAMYSRKRMSQHKDKHTYRSRGGRRRKPHHKTLRHNTPHRRRTTRNTNVRHNPPFTIHNIP